MIELETKLENGNEFTNIEQYIQSCKMLNNYICKGEGKGLGLGKSYEFGHSFFMKMSSISKTKEIKGRNMEELFNLHLRPTLNEYLRSVFAESELDKKLKEALSEFKGSLK